MSETINKFDRQFGALQDVGLSTKPSTIQHVQPITGETETFIIQTIRHDELGDFICVTHVDKNGVERIILPPKVSNLIASHRDALTKRRRSISSRATMKARMAAGEVLGFKKKA
jgi:hypothetical protein